MLTTELEAMTQDRDRWRDRATEAERLLKLIRPPAHRLSGAAAKKWELLCKMGRTGGWHNPGSDNGRPSRKR